MESVIISKDAGQRPEADQDKVTYTPINDENQQLRSAVHGF